MAVTVMDRSHCNGSQVDAVKRMQTSSLKRESAQVSRIGMQIACPEPAPLDLAVGCGRNTKSSCSLSSSQPRPITPSSCSIRTPIFPRCAYPLFINVCRCLQMLKEPRPCLGAAHACRARRSRIRGRRLLGRVARAIIVRCRRIWLLRAI